jgi:Uracil DNA glycosylase superfamily
MPISPELIKIYSEVSVCNNKCADIRNDPTNGVIGRSYYCPYSPSNVSLLMISKNPGIGSIEEKRMYKPMSGEERVHAHEKFVRARFEGRNNLIKSRYHENILSWVSIILGVEASHEAVFKKSALTALVKCESIPDKTATLPESTISKCSVNFLFKELDVIQPSYLLALGGEAYSFLMNPSIKRLHDLPVGKLYHPSWTNMRGGVEKYKMENLPQLRKQYIEACKF